MTDLYVPHLATPLFNADINQSTISINQSINEPYQSIDQSINHSFIRYSTYLFFRQVEALRNDYMFTAQYRGHEVLMYYIRY